MYIITTRRITSGEAIELTERIAQFRAAVAQALATVSRSALASRSGEATGRAVAPRPAPSLLDLELQKFWFANPPP